MTTPLIAQEIYLLERYTSPEYFKCLVDAFAATVQAAEDALDHELHHLPPDYRRRPRWEQHDITWGTVVLPNFRDTLQAVRNAYQQIAHGETCLYGVATNVMTAFTGQGRDYPADWMAEPFNTRFWDGYKEASVCARNIAAADLNRCRKGDLSKYYDPISQGPLDPPESWPIYRLNPAVRVATDEIVAVTGIYLPDADDSCPTYYWAGRYAVHANIGFDPSTWQRRGVADTVWTLVERVADSGGTAGWGDGPSSSTYHRPNVPAGQQCPEAGWWFTPAQSGSRRYFKQGDTLPSLGGDYGETFWQWSPDQSAPKL